MRPRLFKHMWAGVLAISTLGLALFGCRTSSDTGLDVVVSWQGLSVDQLELSVVQPQSGGRPTVIVPPTLRPTPARTGGLSSPEDVIVHLRDDLDGATVKCRVNALLNGALVQLAESAAVTLRRHAIVTCAVALPAGAAATNLLNGSACESDRQCTSTFCVDGLCCDSRCGGTCQACDLAASPGTCAYIASGTAPRDPTQCQATNVTTCGTDGTCDGSGDCRKYPAGTTCAPGHCDGSSVAGGRACDGHGICAAAPLLSCAPFQCDAAASPARCLDTCTTDADCVTGRACQAGSCGLRPAGGACTADAQCQTGHCADGVCCNMACTGPCVSCNQTGSPGVCRPVPAGALDPRGQCVNGRTTDPSSCGSSGACDGLGACAVYAAETLCTMPMCSGSSLTKAGVCDGTGLCQPGSTMNCKPFGCTAGRCNASCGSDADCVSPATCDTVAASCGAKGIGGQCATGAECATGFCVDGLCCNEICDGPCRSCALLSAPGVCKNVAAGAADPRGTCHAADVSTCGTDGLCDGNGACRLYPAGTTCAPEACNGSTHMLASRCDAQGTCAIAASVSCAPYACNGQSCFASCAKDGDCVPPNVCLGGSCGLRPNGIACTVDVDCMNGHCTDGVCCDSDTCGTCRACNVAGALGRCAAIPAGMPEPRGACADQGAASCGTDGTCDGAGACRVYSAGTICTAASCAGSALMLAGTCDGARHCAAGTSQSCVPYQCGTGACKTMCAGDGDCVAPAKCVSGSCGLRPIGASCAGAAECASGHCTDGVCCDVDACSTCQACNVSGRAGTCQPVGAGQMDPRGNCAVDAPASCGHNGRCDGAGACASYPTGTTCGPATCSGSSSVVSMSTCDGAGRCVPSSTSTSCAPYTCAAGACTTSCNADADCTAPATCAGSLCRLKPLGAECAAGTECDSGKCTDGVCCGSAACGTCQACNVAGFVGACASVPAGGSDPHGRCTATPAASCGTDGVCDGAGACRRWVAGTVCLPATCMNKKSLNPKTCDGAGVCADRGSVNCAPDNCNTATGLCP